LDYPAPAIKYQLTLLYFKYKNKNRNQQQIPTTQPTNCLIRQAKEKENIHKPRGTISTIIFTYQNVAVKSFLDRLQSLPNSALRII